MKRSDADKRKTAGVVAIIILFLAADAFLLFMAGLPRVESAVEQKEWQGLDILKKYRENNDMIGWLQVEGTCINYPVMRGEAYLYRNFSGEHDDSGSLFVEGDWTDRDLCTLVYGHNMWMYGTMFNPLHRFTKPGFFRKNRTIRFYTVLNGGQSAEKRTYEIVFCVRTRVDEWNYAACRYMCTGEELAAFAQECGRRAVQKAAGGESVASERGAFIVLSTCSYHVRGGKGRLLLAGKLTDRTEQTRIDDIKR